MKVLIEPHYLPSLEFFTAIGQSDSLIIDDQSRFRKQTFRNRCHILNANGVQTLNTPVHYKNNSLLSEVTIDYDQNWVKDHVGAINAAYRKSPFYEYFIDDILEVFKSRPTLLKDLNHAMLSVCLELLQWQIDILPNSTENDYLDLRDHISAKQSFENRSIYQSISYHQNFGNTFAANLSILDLLFCQGPSSGQILKESIKTPIERFVM